jgi:hypothetical protein
MVLGFILPPSSSLRLCPLLCLLVTCRRRSALLPAAVVHLLLSLAHASSSCPSTALAPLLALCLRSTPLAALQRRRRRLCRRRNSVVHSPPPPRSGSKPKFSSPWLPSFTPSAYKWAARTCSRAPVPRSPPLAPPSSVHRGALPSDLSLPKSVAPSASPSPTASPQPGLSLPRTTKRNRRRSPPAASSVSRGQPSSGHLKPLQDHRWVA